MYFHHLHFYVRDTPFWTDWFEQKLSFNRVTRKLDKHLACRPINPSAPVILTQGSIEIRLSSPQPSSDVGEYLSHHPPGLADIAFATHHFESTVRQALRQGAVLRQPVHTNAAGHRQCQLQGWADLRHTLVEVDADWTIAHQPNHLSGDCGRIGAQSDTCAIAQTAAPLVSLIDHAVINVPKGELRAAVAWYQKIFGFQSGQSFEINTANSGLCSQVLIHPAGPLQLPINEPSSANSQVQEFLHHNQGAGVQHVALRSADAVEAISRFRSQGLDLLSVPITYYDGLRQRSDCPLNDLSAISQQQLLLDWTQGGKAGMLLQTFTQPIFAEPTFFFEVIERSDYRENGQTKIAQGFGEGNFQALFEAIERAQLSRGSLHTATD